LVLRRIPAYGGLAHELRNPLVPLSNALYLWPALARDPSRMADLRAIMERQVRHLAPARPP
jgi:hypothetical protein